MKLKTYAVGLLFLSPMILAQGGSVCPGGSASFEPFFVDHLAEYAGATHTFGYFFLDIDTNGDGIPNFAQIGEGDDLDGDGLPNDIDVDDDGDNIPDTLDKAGYYQSSGPAAGWAPFDHESMIPSYFRFGEMAAYAGVFPNDYWQYVPNGFHEQNGGPYVDGQGQYFAEIFKNPGAYLYVDLDGNQIPDVLETQAFSNRVPAFALDKDYQTRDFQGASDLPGMLGKWNGRLTGATVFHMTDDDMGTGNHPYYIDYTPYRVNNTPLYTDIVHGADSQADYLIYGTTDESSSLIPNELKVSDSDGVRLWRYRKQLEDISNCREITWFLTTYWGSANGYVNTYYSQTPFNKDLVGNAMRSSRTNGDHFGLEDPSHLVGPMTPDNWYPAFQNLGDHNRVVRAAFGYKLDWLDIATAPTDGSAPIAHDPTHQNWVDTYENWNPNRRIAQYLSVAEGFTSWMPQSVEQRLLNRYGFDITAETGQIIIRGDNGNNAHFIRHHDPSNGVTILSWEDLFNGGDRDYDDILFVTNRAPLEP